ncbi:hypothetical protein Nepgr_011641 [Nepenthes gracilis]|uniref:Uncharacterized protein n=1 Tax=Nepenthes gracilis TaxID=150966 RepID=A0AAD3SEG0_NEPGR|nr:hypothetical protein Nepgr_011641 [Nepenthes gracilis]
MHVLNRQPRLGNSYKVVTDDYQDGDPSFCPSLGRLKRNLEEIRKQFNAYRACPNGEVAFPESRPTSALIYEEPIGNRGGVTKTPSPLPIDDISPSSEGGGPPYFLKKSKRRKKKHSSSTFTHV